MKFLKWFLIFGLITSISIIAYVGLYLQTPIDSNLDLNIETNIKFFEVKNGDTLNVISKKLYQEKLIQNPALFKWIIKISGQANKIKMGEYELNASMKPLDIMAVLYSGKSVGHPFTVTEGMNIFEIAEAYEEEGFGKKEDFLQIVLDKKWIQSELSEILGPEQVAQISSLEGYLFPETYLLTKFMSAKDLVTMMIKKFQDVLINIQKDSDINDTENTKLKFTENQLSLHQIITLASIVEKETGAKEERPIISAVFHNRLKQKMRLQTDPTIIYGMAIELKYMPENITKEDIRTPTPYNTYTFEGLPPGPIANPSAEAIHAALNPDKNEFLFFVSKNEGHHVFSRTYQEHQKNVQMFQMDPKARAGKSWRDLNQ